jgi:hypothetical protein
MDFCCSYNADSTFMVYVCLPMRDNAKLLFCLFCHLLMIWKFKINYLYFFIITKIICLHKLWSKCFIFCFLKMLFVQIFLIDLKFFQHTIYLYI